MGGDLSPILFDMNNIFQIRQALKGFKKEKYKSYYEHTIGNFELNIYPYGRINDIAKCNHADVYLSFRHHDNSYSINLEKDYRFKYYAPIKYASSGCSTGNRMPNYNLCHLIKYLYTLTKG